jgi:hypothetical protein
MTHRRAGVLVLAIGAALVAFVLVWLLTSTMPVGPICPSGGVPPDCAGLYT